MILQRLVSLYERLQDDESAGVAPPGYSRQKIAFEVVLRPDGLLHAIQKVTTSDSANERARPMVVPGTGKPAGSGINPNFLWDRTDYLLGFDAGDKPERTRRCFEAFREKHLALEPGIGGPQFRAVCRFLKNWDPQTLPDETRSLLESVTGGFVVFRVLGPDHGFVHEGKEVRAYWDGQATAGNGDAIPGMCLVTGTRDVPLARLHEPKIQGVRGAQSAGGLLVSFNNKAFESYGHDQSYNAPVGRPAAFAYCTALNYLLRHGSTQKVQIADATTLFWTEAPTPLEELFAGLIDESYLAAPGETAPADPGSADAEDLTLKMKIKAVLGKIARGLYPGEIGGPTTHFSVLGLAPNNARISVRFWREGNLDEFVKHFGAHLRDVSIEARGGTEIPSIRRMLAETGREDKDIPPLLSGALLRAVLEGTPYPAALAGAILRRVRADHEINATRAGVLKAHLNRGVRRKMNSLTSEVPMALDSDRPEAAYHLGRLFATLEKAQQDALPGINDTIKDRYFGAAMATPSSVFPRLIRLSQHHLAKLDPGLKIGAERRIQGIADRLNGFPAHLGLADQGLFAIGYYHQRQDLFKRKPNPAEDSGSNGETADTGEEV
jgi:CRISPR-associated protein Csd1